MSNLKSLAMTEAPTSEVDSQLNNLHNRIGFLSDLVGSLEHRLTPVLTPVGSGENGCTATPRELLSPVSERLRAASDGVDALHNRVQSLLSSLAV